MKPQRKNVDNDSKIVYASTAKQLLKNAMLFVKYPPECDPCRCFLTRLKAPSKSLIRKGRFCDRSFRASSCCSVLSTITICLTSSSSARIEVSSSSSILHEMILKMGMWYHLVNTTFFHCFIYASYVFQRLLWSRCGSSRACAPQALSAVQGIVQTLGIACRNVSWINSGKMLSRS